MTKDLLADLKAVPDFKSVPESQLQWLIDHGQIRSYNDGDKVFGVGDPVDGMIGTLGAGDVFHGAFLAALARGCELPVALAKANRCAALSCRALDGRSAIPDWSEL